VTTPETYLGAARAEGWSNGPIRSGTRDFGAGGLTGPDQFAYSGSWRIRPDGAEALAGARIEAEFGAEKVFLVLGAPAAALEVEVLLDGAPISDRLAGEDVRGGVVNVTTQRLYRLVDLPSAGRHRLELRFEPGVSAYAFTFG
jgi:hypothetical protein